MSRLSIGSQVLVAVFCFALTFCSISLYADEPNLEVYELEVETDSNWTSIDQHELICEI